MAGRPKANIDYDLVDELLEAQCEGTEIAGALGIDKETLYRRVQKDKKIGFSEYKQQKRESGKTILRKAQWDKAVDKKDTSMLIWLGKNYLEQKDKVETEDKSLSEFDKWIRQYEVEPETDSSSSSPEGED